MEHDLHQSFDANTTSKKYKLIRTKGSRDLYRVCALRDFGNVKRGEIGGLVHGEHNLSHEGTCWIADDATVRDGARVTENAVVSDFAWISGNVHVSGNAHIGGWVRISGIVNGPATEVKGDAYMYSDPPDPADPMSP